MKLTTYNGDAALEARVRVLESLLEEREKMLNLTAENLDKRLCLLNELRSDVLTKSEYIRAHEAMVERMEKVEKMQSRMVGIGIVLIALSGLIGLIISHFLKP